MVVTNLGMSVYLFIVMDIVEKSRNPLFLLTLTELDLL